MKKSSKIILSIIGVGVIGGLAYILIKRYRNNQGNGNLPVLPPPNGNTPIIYPPTNGGGGGRSDDFPLKYGSFGRRVEAMQRWLNDTDHWLEPACVGGVCTNPKSRMKSGFMGCTPKLVVDGDWGPLTDACYKSMRPDGITITSTYFQKWISPYNV